MKFQKIYKISLVVLTIALFLFLIDRYFVFNGKFNIKYDFCSKPTLISLLEPDGRALNQEQSLKTKECYQRVVREPVYFTAELPRSFDNAEVSLTYSNPEQKIIELGIQKSADWNFELKPLENKFIDESEWERLDKDNIILLQKQKDFNSIDDFLNNLPTDKKIAVYNYQPKYNFIIEDYQPSDSILEVNAALRGRHEFYTYLENEDLDFTFSWQDINWGAGKDDFIVKVYKDDVEIYNDFNLDDGNEGADGVASELKQKKVLLTNLNGGLYKIALEVSDDIFIRKIKTKQHLLVAKNKLFLAANEAYQKSLPDLEEVPNVIHSNSDNFSFQTDHPSGLQTIKINNEDLAITELSKYIKWQPDDNEAGSVKTLNIKRNDIAIEGYGYFALNKDSFFDPDYGLDNLKTSTDIEQYDYLLAADYIGPVVERRWQTATENFSLDGVPGDRKTLQFVISAPNLDDVKEDVVIKEISLKLNKQALSFKNLWPRLKYQLGIS